MHTEYKIINGVNIATTPVHINTNYGRVMVGAVGVTDKGWLLHTYTDTYAVTETTPAGDIIQSKSFSATPAGLDNAIDYFNRNARGVTVFWGYDYNPETYSLPGEYLIDINPGNNPNEYYVDIIDWLGQHRRRVVVDNINGGLTLRINKHLDITPAVYRVTDWLREYGKYYGRNQLTHNLPAGQHTRPGVGVAGNWDKSYQLNKNNEDKR